MHNNSIASKTQRGPAAHQTLEERVERLAPWFHDLDLDGVRTAPEHPLGDFHREIWSTIGAELPTDLGGATVLDIGCNAGFYSFQLRDRGATVTGIDHDARYLEQARLAAQVLGDERVEFRRMEAYDVASLGRSFDYVLFLGVLYHLRYPLLALDRIAPLVRRRVVIQSLVRGAPGEFRAAEDYAIDEADHFERPDYPAMYFIEHSYAGDPTNWWVPNEAGLAAMIRSAGLRSARHFEPGIHVCDPAERAQSRGAALRYAGAQAD